MHAQLPKPRKSSWIRSMLPPVVVGILLIAAIPKWLSWRPARLEPSRNAVYVIRNAVWQPLPELPGEPEKLQVSQGGAVWALVWRRGVGSQLARLDGAAWQVYTAKDFGAHGVDVSAGFVLDGEEVWAPSAEGVLHWDGRRWQCYREAVGTGDTSSIAAAQGQVWVLDDKGSLAHFDGRLWKVDHVELPGASWSDNKISPDLARTGDGSLWIVRNGVWRWDGSAWTPVTPDGEDFADAGLVGVTSQRIWLWDGDDLQSVTPDGTLESFSPGDMGLRREEEVNEVVEAGGRTEAATSEGLLEFDGKAWRRLAQPPKGVRGVVGVRAGAGGDLLAIGEIPNPLSARWRLVVALVNLLLMLGVLAVVVWMVRIRKRRQLGDHQLLQQAVAHATGAVPEEFARDERLLAKQSSWWSATVTVGVIVGALVGFSIARLFWPHVPSWMFLVFALGLHLLASLGQTLVKRTPKPWDPIEPGGPGFDWGPTRRALPASLAVFLLMNLGDFPKWMGDPVLWLASGALVLLCYNYFEARLLNAAIRRGDCQRGMKVVRWFYFYNPQAAMALQRRGHLLLLAGRFRESEETLRRAVARLRSRRSQAQALEFLGDALLEQGRYDEARRSYEAALNAAPGFRRPYRGMAELTLRQGRDPAQALEYIENIVGPKGPSWNPWTINGRANDDYWSLKAWALAELGRGAEAPAAMAEAIRKTNPKSRPDVASTYHRLGLAMQAMDRPSEAEQYLQKAIAAGPHGRWPTLARSALARKRILSA
jgi:tetratricopeptide (TPR) repeat protein